MHISDDPRQPLGMARTSACGFTFWSPAALIVVLRWAHPENECTDTTPPDAGELQFWLDIDEWQTCTRP